MPCPKVRAWLYYTTSSYFILYILILFRGNYNEDMNTQKPLKNKVSITLDEDVITQIHKLAESDDRNFSQYINLILKKHIQEKTGAHVGDTASKVPSGH